MFMEIITTFKGVLEDIEKYPSIVIAPEEFSIANDHSFSNKQIEGLTLKCNEKGKKVYLLVNKMIFEEELTDLKLHLEWIKKLDITGIFFSDMAVYMLAKELNMESKLIYSPGMTIVNSEDVKEYTDLNIMGLELANELTLDEKIEIANNNPNKVGVVISGYLLMSYSKRKVLTNYFNYIEKDKNLDNNFDLRLKERTREGLMPIYEDRHGSYIYSEYVFHSFNYLKQLLSAPFKYFRIDGIFLSKEVIEDILHVYEAMILGREDNFLDYLEVKYPEYNFDDIFYQTKTSEVK